MNNIRWKKFLVLLALGLAAQIILLALGMRTEAKTKPENPKVVFNSPEEFGSVTYDCVWLGSYPQTEIVEKASACGNYGKPWALKSDYEINQKLYQSLANASGWDSNGDIVLSDGTKYRRIKADNAALIETGEEYYSWQGSDTYHYFRYEPIKWRVLETDGSAALLLADQILDIQKYNESDNTVAWESSTIRSWLNGYDASMNTSLTDFTDSSFINSAFTDEEKEGLISKTLDNKTTGENADTYGGENTVDKVFLLSENDYQKDKYGFSSYNSGKRISKSSTYAKARGVHSRYDMFLAACSSWWLRSPGRFEGTVRAADYSAEAVTRYVGLRPVCSLNLALSSVYKYAGTVCSDGSMKQENDGDDTVRTYTVTYNANGGEQAPAKQKKTEGKKLLLSGTEPKRRGYKFVGWKTSKNSEWVQFFPLWFGDKLTGGEYFDDSDITLYAAWEKMTYYVDYDWNPNGTISRAIDGYSVYFKGSGKLDSTMDYIMDYNVDELYVEEGITSIGADAFRGYTFKKVHLPNSLVSIGKGAFSESKIGEINIPKNLKTIGAGAFSAESVQKINFDYGLKIVGGFQGIKIDKIVIPGSVTTIKKEAFGASSINTVDIPGSVKRIEKNAFSMSHVKKVIFHEGLEYIGERAFGECTKLQNIKLPNTVKTIENGAFNCCDTFTEIVIPGSVTKLGAFVLDSNHRLKSVTIEDGVTEIPNLFCYGCGELKSVELPSSVKSIGKSAFECCENLEYIYVPGTTKTIGAYSLGFTNESGGSAASLSNSDDKADAEDLLATAASAHHKISGFVICGKAGSAAHKYAKKHKFKFIADRNYKKKFTVKHLKYIISDNKEVTCYGSDQKIKILKVPDKVRIKGKTYKVTRIGGGAFKRNRKITKAVLGKNIKVIGARAFYKCSRLKSIKIKTKGLQKNSVKSNALKGTPKSLKVYVPKKKKSMYKKIFLKRGLNKKAKVVSY